MGLILYDQVQPGFDAVTMWITDAIRFIDVFGEPISQSMPHIYLSALAFAPWTSMIPQHYASLYPSIGILKADRLSSWLDIQPILTGHTDDVNSVAFSPDGARIASGSDDQTIRLWDAKTGAAVGEPLRGHTGLVLSVAFSPDGARIASGSGDETIRLWDAKTGAAIGKPLQGHADWVNSIAFSPDGARIASGSRDETIRLWDAKTGAAIGEPLRGHTEWVESVESVAFSPDGARIASGSDDKTVRLWNAKIGAAIGQPFHDHTRSVQHAVFSDATSSCSDETLQLQRTSINHGGTALNIAHDPTSLPTTDVVPGMKCFPLFVSHPGC